MKMHRRFFIGQAVVHIDHESVSSIHFDHRQWPLSVDADDFALICPVFERIPGDPCHVKIIGNSFGLAMLLKGEEDKKYCKADAQSK